MHKHLHWPDLTNGGAVCVYVSKATTRWRHTYVSENFVIHKHTTLALVYETDTNKGIRKKKGIK